MIKKAQGLNVVKPMQLPKFPNIGLGGVAGAGKTHLLGTVGKKRKALIMDTEGGSVTYNSDTFKADAAAADHIDIIGFDGIDSCTMLVNRVESTLDYLIQSKNSDGYSLVALDSLTEFQERFLSMHQANDKRQSYGALREALYSIVLKARQVPVLTVFTGRLRATHDEVLNREIVRLEVSPGVYSVISGLFDSLGFLDVRKQGVAPTSPLIRTLDFTHNTRTQGKDRYGFGNIERPTFEAILGKLEGNAT